MRLSRTATLTLTSSTLASWASGDPTVYFGVDYTGGTGSALTNCNTPGLELDPAIFGTDVIDTLVTQIGGWGAGIGDFGPQFYGYGTNPGTFADFVGARINATPGFIESDAFYAQPVEIDPTTFEAQLDTSGVPITISPASVDLGGNIATGWYRIFSFFIYTF